MSFQIDAGDPYLDDVADTDDVLVGLDVAPQDAAVGGRGDDGKAAVEVGDSDLGLFQMERLAVR